MEIFGRFELALQHKKFKDLVNGDVFCFLSEVGKCHPEIKIYMKCNSNGLDNKAVNLETGLIYGFDENEPVEILSTVLKIKNKEN